MTQHHALTVQNLCAHHRVDTFDCGDEGLNTHLTALHADVTLGSHSNVFALAQSDFFVAAFMELGEVELLPKGGTTPARYVVVSAVAVSRQFQQTSALARLVLHGFNVTRHFDMTRETGYAGIACVTHTNPRLHKILSRLGFRSDPTGGFYVVNDFRADSL